MKKNFRVFLEKIKTFWNFTTNLLVALFEKLFNNIYTFKLSFLASESCFDLSLSVLRTSRSFSEEFLVRLLASCFLLELGTSSLTFSWIKPIATSRFSGNSPTSAFSWSFFLCKFVTALLNTDPLFCCLLYFLFPLSATAGEYYSIKC